MDAQTPTRTPTLTERTDPKAKGSVVNSAILTLTVGFSPGLPSLCPESAKYSGQVISIVPLEKMAYALNLLDLPAVFFIAALGEALN